MYQSLYKSIFPVILIYMVQIAFLSNLVQCVYYVFYFKKSFSLVVISLVSSLVVLLVFYLSPKFQESYYKFLFHEITLGYISFVKKSLTFCSKKFPFLCFFLVYSFFTLAGVHLILSWSFIHEPYLELIYQVLNFLRLLVFPYVITLFVLEFSPQSNSLKMDPQMIEIGEKTLREVAKGFAEFLHKSGQTNPAVAALILATGGYALASNLYTDGLKNQLTRSQADLGLDITNIPDSLTKDPAACALYQECCTLLTRVNGSPYGTLGKDVVGFLSGNPTLRDQIEKVLPALKLKTVQAVIQERDYEKAQNLGMSSLASRSQSQEQEFFVSTTGMKPRVPSIFEPFDF